MMIREVLTRKILRVRQGIWAHSTDYVTFDYVNGGHGPWAHLYARTTQEAIGESTPQDFLVFQIGVDQEFEEYAGPIDPHDTRQAQP